jgi:hypothetical protein
MDKSCITSTKTVSLKKKINRKNQKNQEKEKKYIEKEKEKKHTDYHPVSFYVYFTFC